MGREIERKFLVTGDGWRVGADAGSAIRQAYLSINERCVVRLRIAGDGESAALTIKSAEGGRSRLECEYDVPADEAKEMFALREGAVIEKRRHRVAVSGLTWEVDVFEDANEGLALAEVELADGAAAVPPRLP